MGFLICKRVSNSNIILLRGCLRLIYPKEITPYSFRGPFSDN